MFDFLLTFPYCAMWLHKFVPPLYLKTQKNVFVHLAAK